ncbi:MAG: phosphorylase [Deltaproteobacteria bacterium CG17_big_fil_post_rev_8_21_14_2_50_63_7]|nr:MAG: phosphorylase [Deltaproteobacteria bacterium CG17_big_fil_post_rev_8_21_14_2_50_63_7]
MLTLLNAQTVADEALRSGALCPLTTRRFESADGELPFEIRILDRTKERGCSKTFENRPRANPFLPYDPALYVSHVGESHVCLLNKYPIINGHLLLVTSEFRDQREALDLDDFTALVQALRVADGLVFYNSGRIAGASQQHKHLQLVPWAAGWRPPLERWLEQEDCQELTFRHLRRQLEPDDWEDESRLLSHYLGLLDEAKLTTDSFPLPYNLLMTRRYLVLIPRSKESFVGISVNALGFCGALLVFSDDQAARIESVGAMQVLARLAGGSVGLFS